jgi:hypothetical protein
MPASPTRMFHPSEATKSTATKSTAMDADEHGEDYCADCRASWWAARSRGAAARDLKIFDMN